MSKGRTLQDLADSLVTIGRWLPRSPRGRGRPNLLPPIPDYLMGQDHANINRDVLSPRATGETQRQILKHYAQSQKDGHDHWRQPTIDRRLKIETFLRSDEAGRYQHWTALRLAKHLFRIAPFSTVQVSTLRKDIAAARRKLGKVSV